MTLDVDERAREAELRAVTAVVFCAAAVLACVQHLVLNPDGRAVMAVMAVLTSAAGAGFWWARRWLPGWAYDVLMATGTAMLVVSAVVLDRGTEVGIYYAWPALWSAYFLPPRRAAVQAALIVVADAVGLLLAPGGATFRAVLMGCVDVVLVLGVAMIAFAVLRRRMDLLVAQVRQHASTDPLTGVLNRRGLDARAAVELARSDRHGAVLAVVVLDVDHFKVLNDTAGHEAGDEALRVIGQELRACARAHDVVARMGGEEFLMVLPETSLAEAGAVAERVRGRVARSTAERGAAVTLSAGVAVRSPGQDLSAVRLAADAALYRAKLDGRDRTVLTGADAPAVPLGREGRRG